MSDQVSNLQSRVSSLQDRVTSLENELRNTQDKVRKDFNNLYNLLKKSFEKKGSTSNYSGS